MKYELINGSVAVRRDDGSLFLTLESSGMRTYSDDNRFVYHSFGQCFEPADSDECFCVKCGETTLTLCDEGKGIRLSSILSHKGEDLGPCGEYVIVRGRFSSKIKKIHHSGPRDCNGVKINDMVTEIFLMDMKEGMMRECGDFAACITEEGKSLIAGFLTYLENYGAVYIYEDGTFEVIAYEERKTIRNGEILKSDIFYITDADDIVKDLSGYCDLCVKYTSPVKRVLPETPSGYCTWYYYLDDVNEKEVLGIIEDSEKNRDSLPVQYIQIDDGWQVLYGQWEPNEKFPGGIKYLADRIRKAGFLPGLWFAPIWSNRGRIRIEHPEYFAVDRRTGGRTSCLDLSIPEAANFLSDVMKTATVDWGIKYLKLDGFTAVFGAYEYQDPSFNSLKNYRRALEIINESVPDDTFIMSCTCPFGASIGLADAVRTGRDIGGSWDDLCNSFVANIRRYHYNNRFFINDADCLIIRSPEEEDDECARNCTRTESEIKVFISASAASGGLLMLSDKLRLLKDEKIRDISYLFPLNTTEALPLDLMTNLIPGILDCGLRGKIRTVILINWEDCSKKIRYDLEKGKRYNVFEFWENSFKGIYSGSYESEIPPHSCEVLHITEADGCAIIASCSELIPVIEQSSDEDMLKFTFAKKRDSYIISAEGIDIHEDNIEKIGGNLYKVTQTGDCMEETVRLS